METKEYSLDDAYFSINEYAGFKWELDDGRNDELMKKSVIGEGFHTLKQLPFHPESKTRKKKKPAVRELPEEVQTDLKVLKMRSVLDPKRFYKRSAFKGHKDNLQVGVVLDSPADFFHSRLPNRLRKKSLVDELLADANFKKNIKRRYAKIIEENKDKKRFKKKFKNLKAQERKHNYKQKKANSKSSTDKTKPSGNKNKK